MWRFFLALIVASILPASGFAWAIHGHRIVRLAHFLNAALGK